MCQIVPCVIVDISWKFHENPFIYFVVMLLTDTQLRLDGRPWNSLTSYFLCRPWHFFKMSWKSVHPFFHHITNRSRIQGVNSNIPKMIQIAFWLMSNPCWKFHENPFINFSVMLLKDTDSPENVEMCTRGLMEHPETVPHYFLYQVSPSLKISWKPVDAIFP